MRAIDIVAEYEDFTWVEAFNTLCHGFEVDNNRSLEAFVCVLYGYHNTKDINEARRGKLYQLAKWKKGSQPSSKIGQINCSLIPPCRSSLEQKILRAKFVANMWMHASSPRPCHEMDPKNFGWRQTDGMYERIWYTCPMLPTNIEIEESEGNGEESDVEIEADAAEDMEYE